MCGSKPNFQAQEKKIKIAISVQVSFERKRSYGARRFALSYISQLRSEITSSIHIHSVWSRLSHFCFGELSICLSSIICYSSILGSFMAWYFSPHERTHSYSNRNRTEQRDDKKEKCKFEMEISYLFIEMFAYTLRIEIAEWVVGCCERKMQKKI